MTLRTRSDQTESCELYVLRNDTTASLRSGTNEGPEEETLLLAIMSKSASGIAGNTRYRLFGL